MFHQNPTACCVAARLQRRRNARHSGRPRGLTLIELLLVIGIIVLLLALLLPAVQAVRSAARRNTCSYHLRQLGVAIANYESVHQMLPPGSSGGMSLFVNLLPYLEQQALADRVGYSMELENEFLGSVVIPTYVCPSDSAPHPAAQENGKLWAGTNYAACSGTWVSDNPAFEFNGMFRILEKVSLFVTGPVTSAQVTDGLSQTAALSEILRSDGSGARLRVNWYLADEFNPGEIELFAEACRGLSPHPTNEGWRGNRWSRGMPWFRGGNLASTFYNTVLLPNEPSCLNGNTVTTAASTAASLHPGGVHLLFGDGHVDFVSDSIDVRTWRQYASKDGGP